MLWSKAENLELQFKRTQATIAYLRTIYPEVTWQHVVNTVFCIPDTERFFSHASKIVLKEKIADLDENDLNYLAILLVNIPLRQTDSIETLFVELRILARGSAISEIERFYQEDKEVIYYQAGTYTVRVEISDSLFEFELGSDTEAFLAPNWWDHIGGVPQLQGKFDIKPLSYCGNTPFMYQIKTIEDC
jgi:hypothetical protein